MTKIGNRKSEIGNARAFTLIELLVVISIIAVLAALTIPVLRSVRSSEDKKVARVELEQIGSAIDSYQKKYGVYPPDNASTSSNLKNALWSQLYYELSGTHILQNGDFETLDGSATISPKNVKNAYGVDGFLNCTHGSVEDGNEAKDFLPELKPNRYVIGITNDSYGNKVPNTAILVTSVGGPDPNYQPLGPNTSGLNPFRYQYPGTHNPNSYDLWVQLVIHGQTNLICNWNDKPVINSPLP